MWFLRGWVAEGLGLREGGGVNEPEREALKIAVRALAWYADERHWYEDDWNVRCVVRSPEYGDPGKKARNALLRIERLTRQDGDE